MSERKDFDITNAGKLKRYLGTDEHVVVPEGVVEVTYTGTFRSSSGGPVTITLPEGLKKISFSAFSDCRNLLELNIPDSVTHITPGGFNWCNQLRSVNIPASIQKMEGAFSSCESLWDIIVPDNAVVREKCWAAFASDTKIKYCLTNIRRGIALTPTESAFFKRSFSAAVELAISHQDAQSLAAVFATKKKVSLDVIDPLLERCADMQEICAFLLEYKNTHYSAETVAKHCEDKQDKELDPTKRSVADWRKIFKFPASLKEGFVTIDAYKGSESVVMIPGTIGDCTVTAISKQAFMKLKEITEIIIGEGVKKIGMRAFMNCFGITKVTLPESLAEIGWGAFAGCTSLAEISIPGRVLEIGHGAFENCFAMKKAIISEGVTEIGERAFYFCKEMQSISIPASVTSIGFVTFSGCEKLTIHAPAGSYAETYAKENNIPFVAE